MYFNALKSHFWLELCSLYSNRKFFLLSNSETSKNGKAMNSIVFVELE